MSIPGKQNFRNDYVGLTTRLTFSKKQLKSAGKINLDFSLGTSVLCQKSALKLSNLANVFSQGNELASAIKTSASCIKN